MTMEKTSVQVPDSSEFEVVGLWAAFGDQAELLVLGTDGDSYALRTTSTVADILGEAALRQRVSVGARPEELRRLPPPNR